VRRVRPEPASHLARWEHRPRLARQAAARRVVLAVLWAWLSERPHSAASPVRQAAAARSCFRRVAAVAAQLSELAWWQGPEAASHRPVGAAAAREMASPSAKKAEAAAGVAESSAPPVASARLPAEGAAVASDAKVRQPEVAEVRPGLSAQQPPGAAAEEAVSAAQALPREEAAVELDVRGQPPEAAGAVALDAAAELQREAAALLDAEARRPEAAAVLAVRVLLPAGRPSALPSWRREGRYLPWPAPRRAARSAHALRRSRTASPSRRSLRAAGCEGLS
jgi:hypothetical protein